ncbi:MAG: hypothetical protein A2285_07545 [Elusimicrobia bacterium RIFOXYA12_FULL_57_11]|nr:MAG: hypothetical protein A2285_07545 [Elusimicrobia bacterium RIFOXYA12_FULL_57_11]
MKKTILLFSACLAAQTAGAAQFEALDLEKINRETAGIPVPAARQGNYYLDPNSYDPLLMGRGGQGQKINVIGGSIEIPGMDGTLDFARKYRQAVYSVHDLQSDVALTVYTKGIAKTLFNIIIGAINSGGDTGGGTYSNNTVVQDAPALQPHMPTEAEIMAQDIPEEEKERMLVQLRNSRLTMDGRINPFKVDEMVKMLLQIMKEESANGITPKLGTPHTWSPQFIEYCKKNGEIIPLGFTKLLVALASGVTSRHFKTGQEEALINYVLAQPDKSVTMDQLFRASYRLNKGEFYLTILTNLNILSDYWRHPQRDQLAVTRKLAVISNFYQGKGDKYGAWYHFQGIMLYGYVRGGLRAWLVGGIETAGSHILSGANDQNEQQEDYVNATGGKVGARIAKAMERKEYVTFRPDRNYCNPDVYLNLNEDFRDRIEFVESRDFKTRLDENRMWLTSLTRDYLDCHVEIMYNDATGKLNSQNLVKQDHVDFRKGKNVPLLVTAFEELTLARAFISGCLAAAPVQKDAAPATKQNFFVDAAARQ